MTPWSIDPQRINLLCDQIEARNPTLVIDIGGNDTFRLPVANHVVGWDGDVKLDLSTDDLPYADDSVDYVFCRHTIEDLADPTHLLSEIQRVAKAGYLETPSVLTEVSRGVDAAGCHCGYSHHRWMCYSENGSFTCLAKYPCVEYLDRCVNIPKIEDNYEDRNFCYEFEGKLRYRVIQNEQGVRLCLFDQSLTYPMAYFRMIDFAIGER